MRPRKATLLVLCVTCFVSGYFAATFLPNRVAADPAAPAREGTRRPAEPLRMPGRLSANLYMQTAAEYRACCLQVYRTAEMRLAALLQTAQPRPPRPAVVMDLDETVFDNATFQTYLIQQQTEFSLPLWDVYERAYPVEVGLVPGAKRFVERAAELGVTVVFMSNRLEKNRAGTLAALRRLGLWQLQPQPLLILKKDDETSDKTGRRDFVAARYNVLLYFGDNLRDFSEIFVAPKVSPKDGGDAYRKAIAARFQQVDEAACHWGVDWFVLPNPAYGEWERLIADDPMGRLRPTKMRLANAGE